jgi:hypothetical protein
MEVIRKIYDTAYRQQKYQKEESKAKEKKI